MSWTGIPELKAGYQAAGPVMFTLILIGVLLYAGIFTWLATDLEFPRAFGSSCRRKCLIEGFWFSPALLTHGGWKAYALFAFYWSMPALVVGAFIYATIKKRRAASRTRIKPLISE